MARQAVTPKPKSKAKTVPKPAQLEDPQSGDELTNRQRAFVEHYLTCWNATEAARRAKYSAKTAQEQGSRLLSNVMVQAAIAKRLTELKMTADEVLLRLAQHARGDIGDLLDASGNIDLKTARRLKRLHLVRRISDTDKGISVEMYDAQAALVQIGRALKMFVDRQELTGKDGGPIAIEDVEAVRQKRWAAAAPALAQAEAESGPIGPVTPAEEKSSE